MRSATKEGVKEEKTKENGVKIRKEAKSLDDKREEKNASSRGERGVIVSLSQTEKMKNEFATVSVGQ
jgi:hypothetical protein